MHWKSIIVIGLALMSQTASAQWGYIDKTGRTVIGPRFSSAGCFTDGVAAVKLGDEWLWIDSSGAVAVRPQAVASEIRGFSGGLAAVCVDKKWGFVDKTGALAIAPKYEHAQGFGAGRAAVCYDGKWGYIDKTGAWVIPAQYKSAWSFTDGLATVMIDTDYCCIDVSANVVIRSKGMLAGFSEGLAPAWNAKRKCGFINKSGKFVIAPQWDSAGRFSDGLAVVANELKSKSTEGDSSGSRVAPQEMMYIDKSGNDIFGKKWDHADPFSEGLAAVGKDGNYGYIDKNGNYVIEPKLGPAFAFSEGLAPVRSR